MSEVKAEEILADAKDLFETRVSETKRYFDFLHHVIEGKAEHLARSSAAGPLTAIEDFEFSRELVKTLKANGYILIYNIVESTSSRAIDAIHEAIRTTGVGFDELNLGVQKVALRHFRRALKGGNETVLRKNSPIHVAMANLGYDRDELFSGNVDRRKIVEKSEEYGFTLTTDTSIGHTLLAIKNTRNALAHGEKSFEECGQETSIESLIRYFKDAEDFLTEVLRSVEEYIERKLYLNTPPNPTVQSGAATALEAVVA